MKKIMMMALTLVFTGVIQAQVATISKKADRTETERTEKMSPEERAKKRLAKMSETLKLDEKQEIQMYSILLEQAQLKERHRIQREEMRKQAEANREKSEARISEVLTPEQRKEWEVQKAERKEKIQERRQGQGKQYQRHERSGEMNRSKIEQTK